MTTTALLEKLDKPDAWIDQFELKGLDESAGSALVFRKEVAEAAFEAVDGAGHSKAIQAAVEAATAALRDRVEALEKALEPFVDCVVMSDGPRLIIGFESDEIAVKAASGLSDAIDARAALSGGAS